MPEHEMKEQIKDLKEAVRALDACLSRSINRIQALEARPEKSAERMTITFSKALEGLKMSSGVTRTGWGDQYIMLQRQNEGSEITLPHIYLQNAHGEFVPWVPSHEDILADDWFIVSVFLDNGR